jgi:transmembrane 9 superfamily protein 3
MKEIVSLWVNTVGPYHNPQETYTYYQLPFCKPSLGVDTKKRPSGIGEILEGNELRNSGFKVHYTDNVDREDVCDMTLSALDAATFESAVDQQYWYELFLDDLPMWGMVGEVLRDAHSGAMEKHIFTHRSLSISYNQNQIIEANLTSEDPVVIKPGAKLSFTYSIKWLPTTKSFDDRFNRYLEYDFFEHQIHWFSVFNSFMMVVFLCGLVALILLRTLRNDFARYAKDDEIDVEGMHVIGEDSGWKQVHGDVFRAPSNLVLYSAMVGTGWQLLALILGVIFFAMAGPVHGYIYEDRGELVSSFIVLFALSSSVAGYASGSYYRQYFTTPKAEQASQWQKTMIVTILLFPGSVVAVIAVLNSIAIYYDTISAIPAAVIVKMVAIWLFVALPLSVAGTLFGRHWVGKGEPPTRVNSLPRPIPEPAWYADPIFVVPMAGVLPFGSIFIEMYFIFTAFWSYKFYYVYGFMLLVYCILSMVTICVTIVAVYFVLNAENYNWQWLAFTSAGSTAGYVYMYSVFYFFYKTEMTGLLQTTYFFGYMLLFCSALFLMCGTIGSWGAGVFVRKIYNNVKID